MAQVERLLVDWHREQFDDPTVLRGPNDILVMSFGFQTRKTDSGKDFNGGSHFMEIRSIYLR